MRACDCLCCLQRTPAGPRAPNGIRTRATALKGRRPGPLDDGGCHPPLVANASGPRSSAVRDRASLGPCVMIVGMSAGGAQVDEVRYDVHGAAAVVTIDRQHRRNAIDGRTADALVEALERFEADDERRVLVLTGAGEAFCAGADLTAIETLS